MTQDQQQWGRGWCHQRLRLGQGPSDHVAPGRTLLPQAKRRRCLTLVPPQAAAHWWTIRNNSSP